MTRNWPKYVYEANGRMVYRPRVQPPLPCDKQGFLKPPVKLGRVGDKEELILAAYLEAKREIEAQATGYSQNTLGWLKAQFEVSRRFKELSPASQANLTLMSRMLNHPIKQAGKQITLGDMPASALTKPMLRQLFERRLKQYQDAGKKGSAMVNRERAFLSVLLSWGMQHIEGLGLAQNPCQGITGFKETARTRYVTDDEYNAQMSEAKEVGAYLPVVFELCYLCAARGSEIVALRRDSIKSEGLLIRRGKGSRDNIIMWSPRLRKAVDDATAMHPTPSLHLILNTHGQPLNKSTLDTAMQRLKAKMDAKGLNFWTLHDLKRKGLTEAKDKAIAGHKTEAMRQRYNVGLDKYEPPA